MILSKIRPKDIATNIFATVTGKITDNNNNETSIEFIRRILIFITKNNYMFK